MYNLIRLTILMSFDFVNSALYKLFLSITNFPEFTSQKLYLNLRNDCLISRFRSISACFIFNQIYVIYISRYSGDRRENVSNSVWRIYLVVISFKNGSNMYGNLYLLIASKSKVGMTKLSRNFFYIFQPDLRQ